MPMKPLPKTRKAPVGHSKEEGDNDATARTGSKACSSILKIHSLLKMIALNIIYPFETWLYKPVFFH